MTSDTPASSTHRGRYNVTWTASGTIKRVEITSRDTGRRAVGGDWATWDAAYQHALHRMFPPAAKRLQR